MKRTRCNDGAAYKAQVAFAAFKSDETLAELATQFVVHPTEIPEWKPHAPDLKVHHAKTGQPTLEHDC